MASTGVLPPLTPSAVFHPVRYKSHSGSVLCTNQGLYFQDDNADNDDDGGQHLISMEWGNLVKMVKNQKSATTAKIMFSGRDDSTFVLSFENRTKLLEAYKDLHKHWKKNDASASRRGNEEEGERQESTMTLTDSFSTSAHPMDYPKDSDNVNQFLKKNHDENISGLPHKQQLESSANTSPNSPAKSRNSSPSSALPKTNPTTAFIRNNNNPSSIDLPLKPALPDDCSSDMNVYNTTTMVYNETNKASQVRTAEEPQDEGGCCRFALYLLCLFAFGCSVAAIADCSFILIEEDRYATGPSDSSYSYSSGTSELDSSSYSYSSGTYAPDSSSYSYQVVPPSKLSGIDRYENMDSYGAFTYDSDREKHQCVKYSDDNLEEYFNLAGKTGRGFGVLASLLGGLVVLSHTFLFLVVEHGKTRNIIWTVSIGMLTLAIPSQFLTFLIMLVEPCKEADLCIPGIAGYFSVLAGLLFLALSLLMCCFDPGVRPLVSISRMNGTGKRLGWPLLIVSVSAWVLSVAAVADCTFVREGDRDTKYEDLDNYGIFRFKADSDNSRHICVAYYSTSLHEISAEVKAGRAFSTLACISSGLVTVIFASLVVFVGGKFKKPLMITARVCAILAFIFEALTLVVFGDSECHDYPDRRCVLGPAGIVTVFNVVALGILACLCLSTSPPLNPQFAISRFEEEEAGQNQNDMDPSDTHLITESLEEKRHEVYPVVTHKDRREGYNHDDEEC